MNCVHWCADRSRKRRSSPCSSDVMMDQEDREEANEDLMDECAAAMVLMRLSCSPHSPRWEGNSFPFIPHPNKKQYLP